MQPASTGERAESNYTENSNWNQHGSGVLIFPGTPIQSTPMNQSAMAVPIVTR
jgi:hypothetical protein